MYHLESPRTVVQPRLHWPTPTAPGTLPPLYGHPRPITARFTLPRPKTGNSVPIWVDFVYDCCAGNRPLGQKIPHAERP